MECFGPATLFFNWKIESKRFKTVDYSFIVKIKHQYLHIFVSWTVRIRKTLIYLIF